MNKLEVLKDITFGDRVAENEANDLQKYFVDTQQWKDVLSGRQDVVYGPKGSGKSAIYLLLQGSANQLFNRSILFVPIENVRGATAFRDIVIEPPTSEVEFVSLWKLYLIAVIGRTFDDYGVDNTHARKVKDCLASVGLLRKKASLLSIFSSVVEFVRRHMIPRAVESTLNVDPVTQQPTGLTGRVVFEGPGDGQANPKLVPFEELFEAANAALREMDLYFWLAIDRLDVAFADNTELETNALRALFKTYLDIQGEDRLSLKVFLRSDIWARITEKGFREASHITRALTIAWSSELLLNLLLRRMLQSRKFVESYGLDRERVLSDIALQRQVFYRAFPEQVDVGARKPFTFDWMLSRTKDGTGYTAPRELIHLLNSITEKQVRRMEIGAEEPAGDLLFSRQAIKEGLLPVSQARLEQTLYAEYPSLKPYIEMLEKNRATQTETSLQAIWRVEEQEARSTAKKLVEVGFFETRGNREDLQYWVPFLYRDALSLVQGMADD